MKTLAYSDTQNVVPFRDIAVQGHDYVTCTEWSDWEVVSNPDGETSWCAVSLLCILAGLEDFGTFYEEVKRSRICTSLLSGYTYVEWEYEHRRVSGFCNCLLF